MLLTVLSLPLISSLHLQIKNLYKLSQDTFFMSYSPLPIYGLDSCPIRAYAIEGLAEFTR